MAVNYGQVAIVPKGVWNAETQYKVNNLVEYDGSSYVAKVQPPVGTLPTDTSYWQVSAAGTKKATADSLGTVMPDGTTTEIKEDGKLSAKTAQQNALGVVKGSDDVTVGEDGTLTVNTTFEQATELANIIAGEAIKSVLGKVSKAIATTMSLDENALLNNMISGIDVNDGSKVPSSAYIHSLVERIGMGTALEGGFDNLTAGLNSVNNNLSNPDRINLNVLIEKTSLNSPERTGVYYVTGDNIGALPPGFSNYGILLCMRSPYSLHPTNSNCVYVQDYTDVYGKHASRSSNNGAWTNWTTTATKDDLTTVSEVITRPSLNGVTFSSWTALAERCGNMVTLSFNTSGTMKAVSDFMLLGTLNVKYRPLKQHFQVYTTQTGKPMTLKIDPNGQFSLFNNNIEVSGFFLRQTITYPAE